MGRDLGARETRDCQRQFNNKAAPGEARSRAGQHSEAAAAKHKTNQCPAPRQGHLWIKTSVTEAEGTLWPWGSETVTQQDSLVVLSNKNWQWNLGNKAISSIQSNSSIQRLMEQENVLNIFEFLFSSTHIHLVYRETLFWSTGFSLHKKKQLNYPFHPNGN